MNKKIILVNEKTFEWIKDQLPADMNPFSLISYAKNIYNSIEIQIDKNLEDNVIKIKEEKK